jgi:hypothetical protein
LQIGGDESFDDYGAGCVLLVQHALSNNVLILYHASSEPIWSVSNFILPFLARTATPMRSQSDQSRRRPAFLFSKVDRHG